MEDAFDNLKLGIPWTEKIGGQTEEDREERQKVIRDWLLRYDENLDALKYLEILGEEDRNVVFIGANGGGKTTLLRKLLKTTGENQVGYYQADRLLLLDKELNNGGSLEKLKEQWKNNAKNIRDVENTNSDRGYEIRREMQYVVALIEKVHAQEMDRMRRGALEGEDSKTDKIIRVWNELIPQNEMYMDGEMKVKTKKGQDYSKNFLSNGERTILYFLSSIFLTERKAYYFIDEPENSLHPLAVTRLWDVIEEECKGSVFVYLTHDINFAISRFNSKKYWIKNFDGKEWEFEELQATSNIPTELILQLIGNTRKILFVEGTKESIDVQLYSKLYPEMHVVPCGGCEDVIRMTKAINLPEMKKINPIIAYGIIDTDRRTEEELLALQKANVYAIRAAEVENLFLTEEVLDIAGKHFSDENLVENVKNELFDKLADEIEQQAVLRARKELKTVINELQEKEGSYEDFKNDTEKLKGRINAKSAYERWRSEFSNIVHDKDYNGLIRCYNRKGAATFAAKMLNMCGRMAYINLILKLIDGELNEKLRKAFEPYVPQFPENPNVEIELNSVKA